METLTSIPLPHPRSHQHPPIPPPPPWKSSYSPINFPYFLPHMHFHFGIFRRRSRDARCRAIQARKFDFNPRSFDDGVGDFARRRRRGGRRRRRRSDQRSKQRPWWSDEDEDDTTLDGPAPGILEQLVDSLWILRVFRSYGWFLPIILISLLLATGPKAFLMASSLPFGLSLLIFAYQKLQKWLEGSPKPKHRRKTRSPFGQRKDAFMKEEDDYQGDQNQQQKRNRRRDYKSRVTQNGSMGYNGDSSSRVSGNSFGGWDELVREDDRGRSDRPFRKTGGSEMMVEEKLMGPVNERGLPLLLRLLIAIFPFLGSWTNLL